MTTLVLLLFMFIIGVCIWGYEKYKQKLIIAKIIDGNTPSNFPVGLKTMAIINTLVSKVGLRYNRYNNTLLLPDKQEVCLMTGNLDLFKTKSELNFEPTPLEWKVLMGVVKKLYSNL